MPKTSTYIATTSVTPKTGFQVKVYLTSHFVGEFVFLFSISKFVVFHMFKVQSNLYFSSALSTLLIILFIICFIFIFQYVCVFCLSVLFSGVCW